jgi:hypothetical protein
MRRSLFFLLILSAYWATAQSDTVRAPKSWEQPEKAALASALVPGAGQILNRQIWKAPIAWGIMAGSGYYLYINQKSFNRLSTAIDLRLDSDPLTVDEFDGQFSTNQLFSLQNDYRRRRDYAVLGVGAGYLFQVLDAYAAGHLVDFDVSPNLNAQVRPSFGPQTTFGAQLTLAWH